MKDQEWLVPMKGLLVRDPVTKTPLDPNGELKPMRGSQGTYWRRRVRDKSVIIGKQPRIRKTGDD